VQRSTDRMLTTHTGSLPRPLSLVEVLMRPVADDPAGRAHAKEAITGAVADIVGRQLDAGLAVVNDGEQSKVSFVGYRASRLSGFDWVDAADAGPTYTWNEMEARDYPTFFSHWLSGGTVRHQDDPHAGQVLACVGPVGWQDFAQVERDVANLTAATSATGAADVFMSAISPATYAPPNLHYTDEDEYLHAIADAMSREYRAIVEAGFVLQVDAPDLANTYRKRDLTHDELLQHTERCVEVINYATRELPAEQVRVHVCCGADEAPHHRDVNLADVVDILMKLRPNGMTIVGANGRHSHEWKVWADVELPDGKVIVPGVIDSTSNIIEHPEAVAERILNYAGVLGREHMIAGVDCGFDTVADMGQVDPSIAWAKLRSLAEGAAIASSKLW
jgi:5-methyltetrahydropteroyltriglutamate--homocysteine methyltransferase